MLLSIFLVDLLIVQLDVVVHDDQFVDDELSMLIFDVNFVGVCFFTSSMLLLVFLLFSSKMCLMICVFFFNFVC